MDGRLYAAHFAAAAKVFAKEDPGIKGTTLQTVEFTAALEVFGRVDEAGSRYLTNEDIRLLWLEGRYPEGWTPRPPGSVGITTLMGHALLMGLDRL